MKMHNKTRDIKDLNIRAMLYMIAVVDNNFIPSNAALDLNDLPGSVSHQIKRIEQSTDFKVFVWGKRKPSHTRVHALKLTKEGEVFYKSVKWFINSISEDL